jgi:catechol 2,3-dioxygenase
MIATGIRPSGLRSVAIGVPDVRASARFYTDVWRLQPVAEGGGSVYLRGSGAYHHILALHPRERVELLRIDLAAAGRGEVDALHARVKNCGTPALETPGPVSEPGGGYGFSFKDPEGRVLRVIAGDERHAGAGPAPDRPVKVTHVVLNTPDTALAAGFFVDALGFKVSDRSLLTFVRCNSDHHNFAFHPGDASTLHHIAFEMPDVDSVMRGAGRMREAGYPIEWGVGRHGPGNNVFAYFVGPDEIVIEYTAEVGQVDDDYRVGSPADWKYPGGRTDLWGVTPPPSERMKAAQQRIAFASEIVQS